MQLFLFRMNSIIINQLRNVGGMWIVGLYNVGLYNVGLYNVELYDVEL